MYRPTTALKKIAALTKPIRIVEGGQGAGKTIGIEMILQNHGMHQPNREITIVQAELSKLKKTAMRDFRKILLSLGLWNNDYWNKTESIYTLPNGTYFEFLGLDRADVGKGFRRDVVYFNEINKGGITLDAFVQFQSRATVTYADLNPDRRFWLHDEYMNSNEADYIRLTHLDNEYLPDSERKSIYKYRDKGFYRWEGLTNKELFAEANIKNKYWANKWRVYGLGLIGSLDGLVFDNWQEIESLPPDARYVGTGLDFGYSNDPTAIVDIYEWNGKRVLNEICYRTGMVNSDIARVIKGKRVYADSAEPKSIEEIRRQGVDISPVTKGADSIRYGIGVMQEQEYLVTSRSVNLKTELNSYTWAKDRDGNMTMKPIDLYNHAIDGVRYHEMETVGLRNEVFTF